MKHGLAGKGEATTQGRQVPLDSPVDPDSYNVGSGDVLAVNIWSSAPVEHTLTVTPEASS